MMAPNNIEFFYAAEETSARIWRIDDRLNFIYAWLVRSVVLGFAVALGLHLKSRRDMRQAATAVSTRIEKEGVKAIVDEDGSVVIKMDGKVQKVLPSAEHRLVKDKDSKRKPAATVNLLNHHTAAQISLLMNHSK